VKSANWEASHFRRLADLVHRAVGIGPSEALAPCELIRIPCDCNESPVERWFFPFGAVRASRLHYALFRALKSKFDGTYYLKWPEDLVQRKLRALASARRELENQIDQFRLEQFLLLRQADQLKEHAHARGVRLIGDLPFFVSPDSSDVWANRELFFPQSEHPQPILHRRNVTDC
jgi:hypothetical protein